MYSKKALLANKRPKAFFKFFPQSTQEDTTMTNINFNSNSVFLLLGGLVTLALSIFLWRAHPVGLAISGIMLTQSFSLFAGPEEAVLEKPEFVFQNLNSGIMIVDRYDVIEYVNQATEKILQENKRAIIGKAVSDVFSNGKEPFLKVENRVYEIKSSPLINDQNMLRGKVVMLYDITEHKANEERLAHLATHDNLTNLPNRELFFEQLSHAIEQSKRNGGRLAVLYLDIDNFKSINDTCGHENGDRVLQEFAKRLKYAIRAEDTAARLSGDEFAILLENISSPLAIETVIEKIFLVLSIPINLDVGQITVTTSIGVSICPKDGGEPKGLMMKADTAMYHVKKVGKNTYQFYNDLPKN